MLYLGAKKSLLSSGKTLAAQIAALFASGEQGAWYDPSLTNGTLFQDAAGTTPVTDVGQPDGLMLDKRLGLVRGPELVSNPGPFVTTTAWEDTQGNAPLSAVGGQLVATPNTTAQSRTSIQMPVVIGKWYELVVSMAQYSGGGATLAVLMTRNGAIVPGTSVVSAVGPATFKFVATTANVYLAFGSNISTVGVANILSSASIKLLDGNHATQPTTTKRPLFQSPPARIVYDGIDDALVTTFPVSLGSSCTICRAIPGVGASILTGQTIGASYSDSTSHAGLIIINRALTAAETASVTAYLNAKAGV